MDERGEWKHGISADLRPERRIELQFRGAGAQPWLLERRNGIARGIYNRLVFNLQQTDSFGGTVMSENVDIGRGILCESDGLRIQSGGICLVESGQR